ncbi:hypothetical protein EVAR_19625_1 [Eumeta japonica]|uniref:Ig-like domain-containing protein n=1 Tax=Eumeta variegata TaxID=151549 RepID=A0A4C1UF73_EUMVA|nr:hypothetical protein EVAR_19625_1 [Eumeta japonica]
MIISLGFVVYGISGCRLSAEKLASRSDEEQRPPTEVAQTTPATDGTRAAAAAAAAPPRCIDRRGGPGGRRPRNVTRDNPDGEYVLLWTALEAWGDARACVRARSLARLHGARRPGLRLRGALCLLALAAAAPDSERIAPDIQFFSNLGCYETCFKEDVCYICLCVDESKDFNLSMFHSFEQYPSVYVNKGGCHQPTLSLTLNRDCQHLSIKASVRTFLAAAAPHRRIALEIRARCKQCERVSAGACDVAGGAGSVNALPAAGGAGGAGRGAPSFDAATPRNVTALVGKSAYLSCRVRNLGNRTLYRVSVVGQQTKRRLEAAPSFGRCSVFLCERCVATSYQTDSSTVPDSHLCYPIWATYVRPPRKPERAGCLAERACDGDLETLSDRAVRRAVAVLRGVTCALFLFRTVFLFTIAPSVDDHLILSPDSNPRRAPRAPPGPRRPHVISRGRNLTFTSRNQTSIELN